MLSLLNLVYSGELDSLGVEKNQLEVMIKTYGKYSDVYNSVKKYEQLTDTAKIDDLNWDIVLNEFAETIPHGMWFDSINLDYDGKEASCVITGRLTEKIIIAQWLTDIEKTGILKNVVCEYLQNIEKSDQIIVSYEINADIDINKIKSDKGMEWKRWEKRK